MASTLTFTLDVFAGQLDRAKAETLDLLRRVATRVVFDCFENIVVGGAYSPGTPVDTGFARASWYTQFDSAESLGDPGVPVKGATHDTGAPMLQLADLMAAFTVGQVVWLLNNVPYIVRLEFGWSKQAPAGMVQLTLAAGPEIVAAAFATERAA